MMGVRLLLQGDRYTPRRLQGEFFKKPRYRSNAEHQPRADVCCVLAHSGMPTTVDCYPTSSSEYCVSPPRPSQSSRVESGRARSSSRQ